MGDGNVGARNAYFELGSGTGIVIFVLDVIKGMLPVLVARAVALPEVVILAAGAVTVAGHNWPIFPGFRGRTRGSTTIGVLFVVVTQPILFLAGPVLATLSLKKNVIVTSCVFFIPLPSSCVLFILLPLLCRWLDVPGIIAACGVVLPCLVGITHYLRIKHVSAASAA